MMPQNHLRLPQGDQSVFDILSDGQVVFHQVIELLLNAIVVADSRGCYIAANDAACDLLGYSHEQILTMNVGDLIVASGPSAEVRYQEFLKCGYETGDFHFRRPDGEERIVEYTAYRVTEDCFVSVLNDVTMRRKESERLRLLEKTITHIQDAIMITSADSLFTSDDPKILYTNPTFTTITGYTAEEVTGKSPRILQGPGTSAESRAKIRQALSDQKPIRIDLQNYRKDGSPYWVELDISPVFDGNNCCTHWLAIQRDITERKQTKVEIDHLLRSISDAFITIDTEGVITYANARAELLFKHSPGELFNKNLWSIHPPEATVIARTQIAIAVQEHHPTFFEMYCSILNLWLEVHAYPQDKGVSLYVRDITSRKDMETELWWRAHHDGLTGLPNREWMRERMAVDLNNESIGSSALFVLDLDGFKYVNDSFGHDSGDHILSVAASRLKNALDTDTTNTDSPRFLARFGGDEFVVWLPGLSGDEKDSRDDAARIAMNLLRALSEPMRIESPVLRQREVLMSVSIGIAISPDDGKDVETLLKSADTALYQAKENGRGKYRFHTAERSLAVINRLVMETRLRLAVQNQKLSLWYQPQVDMITRQVVGVEALLRWHDEELGYISPSIFVPLAEETGLIHMIGEWVLRTACQQVAHWRQSYHPSLRICVNLSALQLVEAGLARIVTSVLNETAIPPSALELELTETALFRSGEMGASEFLREVRDSGVRLAIDDFGTGYSSLSYLRSVPVDVVKIDHEFIRDMVENRQTRAIVRAIIDLAHALGLTVTAEGVEREGQRITLAALECDTIQGYLFSRPIPAGHMERLLQSLPWTNV